MVKNVNGFQISLTLRVLVTALVQRVRIETITQKARCIVTEIKMMRRLSHRIGVVSEVFDVEAASCGQCRGKARVSWHLGRGGMVYMCVITQNAVR